MVLKYGRDLVFGSTSITPLGSFASCRIIGRTPAQLLLNLPSESSSFISSLNPDSVNNPPIT